ncbi:MAG: sigma-54 dependent transcriptional regulator [Campylobacterales bacterium]
MRIAIVEDDINMRKSLEIALADYPEYEVKSFKNARDALRGLDDSFDLVITDITMPGMDGIQFLRELDGRYEAIVITGDATLGRAIEALRLGVKDFLTKPFEIQTLVEAINRSRKAVSFAKNTKLNKSSTTTEMPSGFLASSPALNQALEMAKRAAATDVSVLLLGESGVGKELFARHIHRLSKRAAAPFIPVNMAAIPDSLLESELFGFEKGAFTDAQASKPGLFELANGGTIFLDEIGEMPYNLQAKLLRVLQEREVMRLGSTKPIKIDVRLVSATNANIETKIREGEFREDLYYRINALPIKIPPLRERKEEILPIASRTIEALAQKYELGPKKLGEDAQASLLAYDWPGNIRELIAVCERAVILSEGETISARDLFLESRTPKQHDLASMERIMLAEALEGRTLEEAAKVLELPIELLRKKIDKYGLKG